MQEKKHTFHLNLEYNQQDSFKGLIAKQIQAS